MECTVEYNLPFGDIACQVRNRVRDIVIWHCQNWQLCHRTVDACHNSCAFIDCREFAVKISRESFSAWNLAFGGGYFTHRLRKGCHICENDKDMFVLLKCQIFCDGERYFWCDKTLHDRIVCQIQEHDYVVGYTAFFKCALEKFRNVMLDTHRSKYNSKFFIGIISERSLFYNLSGKLVVWKTVSGKNRKLLSSNQCGQTVDCRDTGADIVSRIFTFYRVKRKSVDISCQC